MKRLNTAAPSPSSASAPGSHWQTALIAAAYAITLKLSLSFPDAESVLAAVWPPSGVALAALLLNPRRRWASILTVIYFTGLIVDVVSGRPFLACTGFMAANVLESLACALLFHRWCGNEVRFTRLVDVVALTFGAALLNALTALVGAASALLASRANFPSFFVTWWISDGLGLLLVTPLIVGWARATARPAQGGWLRPVEAIALFTVWTACAWYGFSGTGESWPIIARPYWILVPLLWAGLRFELRAMTSLLLLLAVIAIGLTTSGQSQYPLGGRDALERLHQVELYLSVTAVAGLALSALLTERRQSDAALREKEAQYRGLFEQMHSGFIVLQVVYDEAGRAIDHILIQANAEFERQTGLDRTKEVGRNSSELPFGWPSDVTERYYAVAAGAPPFHWERFNENLGRHFDVRVFSSKKGQFALVFNDITERKRMDSALQASERHLQEVFRAMVEGVVVQEPSGAIVQCNGAAERILGLTRDQMMGRTSVDPVWRAVKADGGPFPGDEHPAMVTLRTGRPQRAVEMGIDTSGRRRTWIRINAEPLLDESGRVVRVLTSFADVTEQKQAEVALRVSEERFRSFFEMSADLVCVADLHGRFIEINRSFPQVLGYTREELLSRPYLDFIHPEDRAKTGRVITEMLQRGETVLHFENRYLRKDGGEVWLEWTSQPNMRQGITFAIARDVTGRKQAEARLRQLTREQKIIIDHANIGIALVKDRKQAWLNQRAAGMFGYALEELLGQTTRKLYPTQEAYDKLASEAYPVLAHGRTFTTVQELVRRDGTRIWVRYVGEAVAPPDLSQGTLWLLEDITESEQMIKALRESEARFRAMFEGSPDAYLIMEIHDRGRISACNRATEAVLRASKEQILGRTPDEVSPERQPDGRLSSEASAAKIQECIARGGSNFQWMHRRMDGEAFWAHVTISVISVDGRQVLFVCWRDISDRKEAEVALERAHQRLQRLSDNLPNGYVYQVQRRPNGDTSFTYVSAGVYPVHGVPYEEVLRDSATLYGLIHEEDRARLGELELVSQRDLSLFSAEMRLRTAGGEMHWMKLVSSPQRLADGTVQWDGIALDINDHYRLLQQTIEDAQIKGDLLREVNHRVSNNLTSILGLIHGEVRNLEPSIRGAAKPALDRLSQRIRSLIEAHKLLSESKWAPMAVTRLARHVIHGALAADPGRHAVRVHIAESTVQVSPRQAGNLALVLNELVTNTIKHAGEAGATLQISVEVGAPDPGSVLVRYRDNGGGYPAEVLAQERSGIGIELVRSLVQGSLRGGLVLGNDAGAEAVLHFKLEESSRT